MRRLLGRSTSLANLAHCTWAPAFAGVVALLAAPVHSQTVPVPTGPDCPGERLGDPCYNEGVLTLPRPRDVVVTASRVEQEREEVGQAVTVLTRADLDRRQSVSVADLLATTPGVGVTRNGSAGGFTSLRIRGAEGEQTLTVIDGIRVNDPSSPGGGFDFANLLAASVDRIEVLRGPNSVPWGSQAIGGVVNLLTADPARLADGGIIARGQAEYGYADQLYTTAAVDGRSGIVSGSLSGGFLRTDGISAAASGTERDGYRQGGGSGRLGIALSDVVGVDLRGYYAHSRAELDGFPAPAFRLADTDEHSTAQEIYGYAGLNARTGRVGHRVAFTIADINRDNYATSAGGTPSFLGRGRSQRYEYQGDARLVDGLRLVGGVEHEDSRFDSGGDVERTGVTSVYGQVIAQPLAGLTLTGGARHDDHDAFGGNTTVGADAAYRFGGTTLRASYGEGFKAPTLFQLYAPFFGTATLRPERAESFDLGVEQRVGPVSARVTYFRRNTRDQIDFDLVTFTYANIARTRGEGVELELRAEPVDGLILSANYTHLDATNRSPGANNGRELARRPRDAGSIDGDFRFGFGLSIGGTVRVVGRSFDNPGNTVRLNGYTLASIRAELPVGERLTVYGRVENVGDAKYQSVAGYGTYGRAAHGGVRVRLD